MKKMTPKIRNVVILAVILMVCVVGGTTAWATLSFVKPETLPTVTNVNSMDLPAEHTKESKSRAPEPSTLILFGSGIFGMIISFVRKVYAAIKRFMDICAAIIGLIILSPLFLLTAVLIKLTSRGPIIFTQIRVGKNGKSFKIYKFRTMHVGAEKATGPVWASKDDSRLIPCGKFLRKAHIDEIPQFVNILKGDMSLIGPRPERPIFVEKFKKEIPEYEKRLTIKPGLTGLAQVWHKYDETIEDVKKKLKYDLLYIKKLCLWTDLRIILRTVRVVFTGEGAR